MRKELLSFLLCTLASRLFLPCVRVLAPPSSLSQIRQKIEKTSVDWLSRYGITKENDKELDNDETLITQCLFF